jgi:hypothetical protein
MQTTSLATLLVLLLPAIGYVCVNKYNDIKKRKVKPVSGTELTYLSAFVGGAFLIVTFFLGRTVTYFFDIQPSTNGASYLEHIIKDVDHVLFYFVGAFFLSLLSSWIFIKPNEKDSWHGDSNAGRIWGELLAKEAVLLIHLQNGKCYQGSLWEVEVSERVPLNERIVTLYVILSGYRDNLGIVDWNTSYRQPLKHHFSMAEIINFSEYVPGATFKIVTKTSTNKKSSRSATK